MPVIKLETIIDAPIQRCFDLSRSIDLHKETTSKTNEEAIAGVTTGLIGKDEWVTWRAKHFGFYQKLTSEINEMKRPYFFEDRMLKGIFKSIRHQHLFEEEGCKTIMKDIFEFESPYGILGIIANKLILVNYLTMFLKERNLMIKSVAESENWKAYLKE
jgi:ligand-binding SRPBCC domain-containing protein